VTKLLQCLRDELVRRDDAAPTIRSYVQIVGAFRQHAGGRLDRITRPSCDVTTSSSSVRASPRHQTPRYVML
jgi:hypothetical protein